MRFDHGSAYDDEAALEGRPPSEITAIEAERRLQWTLAHDTRSEAERKRDAAERARLAYVRYSPDTSSREILILLGRTWGSLSFDLCRRCRRGHVWSLGVSTAMQEEGLETRMLALARGKAPDRYRWTRSGMASRPAEFWDQLPRDLDPQPEEPCEHLTNGNPGRVHMAWACLRYWRVTGHVYWPGSDARPAARRRRTAGRH